MEGEYRIPEAPEPTYVISMTSAERIDLIDALNHMNRFPNPSLPPTVHMFKEFLLGSFKTIKVPYAR